MLFLRTLGMTILLLAGSCSIGGDFYAEGPRKNELKVFFSLLSRGGSPDTPESALARYAAAHKIASIMTEESDFIRLSAFLPLLSMDAQRYGYFKDEGKESRPESVASPVPGQTHSPPPVAAGHSEATQDSPRESVVSRTETKKHTILQSASDYDAWYLYATASAFERSGAQEIAILYYRRVLEVTQDIIIGNQSIHYNSLSRLAALSDNLETRISCYRRILKQFPDRPGKDPVQYWLARDLEKTGAWTEAVEAYRLYLDNFVGIVPGEPDALNHARRIVELSKGTRDWTSPDLDILIASIRKALLAGSSSALRKLATKVGFFAVSWSQGDDAEGNTQVSFDLAEFMHAGRIKTSESLDPGSGEVEAYLRTEGWSGSIPVWYLYFRKLDFPADPEIHGNWEWAGIYFGEKPK